MNTEHTIETASRFEKIVVGVLYVLIFLLPFLILPSESFFGVSKIILISISIFACAIGLILHSLFKGKIEIPQSKLLGSFGVLFLVYLIAGFASSNYGVSFIGFVSHDTVFFIGLMTVFVYIVSSVFVSRTRSVLLFWLMLIGGLVLGVLELCSLFFPSFVPIAILRDPAVTLFGSMSDTAIYFGLMLVLTLGALEFVKSSGISRYILWCLFVISLVFLTIINVPLVWYVIGSFALIVFIYSFSTKISLKDSSRTPVLPLVILVIAVFSILFAGKNIYSVLAEVPGLSWVAPLNISTIEARPSFMTTIGIGKQVFLDKYILGYGPNRFREAWNRYHPAEVNYTQFWDTDFFVGFSIVISSIVTIGIVGLLSWFACIGFFLYTGYKALFRRMENISHKFSLGVSFLGGLYLWIFVIIYSPNTSIVTLAFFFTGLFIAACIHEKIIPVRTISITEDPRVAFAGVSGLVVSLIIVIVVSYYVGVTFASVVYANYASYEYETGNIASAEVSINKALSLKEDDGYYRFYTILSLAKLNALLAETSGKSAQSDVEGVLQNTLQIASRSVALDDKDYLNWMNLGRVYQTITTPDNPNAYEQALKAYSEAEILNPQNPSIVLTKAQLERAYGDIKKAKEYIASALTKKNDYTDAYFLLSQILIGEGSIKDAITSAEAATLTAPLNYGVFFQLGLLRYNNKDYDGAIRAFERAVTLNPQYANAQYFLGLSYDKVNRDKDAIALFEILLKNNPDNKEVDGILSNLKAGKGAFPSVTSTASSSPEKRTTLPIKDN